MYYLRLPSNSGGGDFTMSLLLFVIMIIIIGCDKREAGEKTGVQADGKSPGAAGTLGKATAKRSCPE